MPAPVVPNIGYETPPASSKGKTSKRPPASEDINNPGTRFPNQLSNPPVVNDPYATPKPVKDKPKVSTKPKDPVDKPVKVKTAAPTKVGSFPGFIPKGQFYSADLSFSLGYQTHGIAWVIINPDGSVTEGDSSIPSPPLSDSEKGELDSSGHTIPGTNPQGKSFGNPLVSPRYNCQYHVMLRITQTQLPRISGFMLLWHWPKGWTWTDGWGQVTKIAVVMDSAFIIRTIQTPLRPEKGYLHYKKKSYFDDEGKAITDAAHYGDAAYVYEAGERQQTFVTNEDTGKVQSHYPSPDPAYPAPQGNFTVDVTQIFL